MNPSVILIVDDVPENLRLLSAILKAAGHRVRMVASGEVALESVRQTPPDLILLDIRLPGADGFTVCRQFKELESVRDIPVIFISAMEGTGGKLKAFQCGGVDYVTKPFQAEEVLARVHAHLEIRRQKIRLQENFRELQKLEQLRDNLTHMIVHDMRSPIMTVDGYHEMLQRTDGDKFSARGARYLKEARFEVARLVRLTHEMLAVSKLEAGKMPLNRTDMDLVCLLGEIEAQHQVVREDKTIVFVPSAESITVSADRDLIGRVLQNLLGNALAFSPAAGRITMSVAGAANGARVEVTDAGPGIPASQQTAIFHKFGTLAEPGRRPGTGLGLTFCKLAIEAHGGRIGVRSEPGQGSTFWFELPRGAA